MTTQGKFIHKGAPSTTKVNADGSGANPEVAPETPKEKSWWQVASPWVHGVLGVASFVPGVSVLSGGLDAAIYAAEGDLVEAGIAAASMIPGGKVVTTAGKVVKGAVGLLKEEKIVANVIKGEKLGADVVKGEKAVKEVDEAAKLKKAEEEAAAAGRKGEKDTTVKGDGQRNICKLLAASIYAQVPEVAKRFLDMMEDKLGLFRLTVNPDGSKGAPHPSLPRGSGTWHGHEQQLRQKQKSLRDTINEYDAAKCTQPKIQKSVRDLAYLPIPKAPGGLPGYPLSSLPK